MLVAFYKPHSDKDCQSEIAKFVDRIWMDKSGNLKVIRTFIVHVLEGSVPLNGLRMLIPYQQVQELYNISDTCLSDDYFLNAPRFSTGGYEIRHFDGEIYGSVYYDYFQTEVYATSIIKSFDCHNDPLCKIISIEFKDNPIKPATFRLLRITFKITSVLDEMFPRVFSIKLDYFNKGLVSDNYKKLDIGSLEIPAIKLFNVESHQGGFDVFLYLPENFIGTKFNDFAMTSSRQLPDGTRSHKPFQKFIWRARGIFPEKLHHLRAGETPFSVEGLLADPYELEDLRTEISLLKEDSGILKTGLGKAKRNSIIAIIIAAFFGLLGIFRQNIWECLGKLVK